MIERYAEVIHDVITAMHNDSTPIVLVHGLCGFNRLFVPRQPAREYFPGVRQALEALGRRVLVPRISPTAGVATRAAELQSFIRQELGRQPVHLIGHSLGGLDARYAITRLGLAEQVRTLITVGTPHRGSSFADWAVSRLARIFRPLFRSLGIPDQAIFDLTTDRCLRFNDLVADVPGVRYVSVAGRCDSNWLGREWRFPSQIVARAEGANDGVVSVASATWGQRNHVWAGDHLNLVNWPNRLMRKAGTWTDRAADYANLLDSTDTISL